MADDGVPAADSTTTEAAGTPNLEEHCSSALSARKTWSIALWCVGALLIGAGVVACRWKPTSGPQAKKTAALVFAGARFPQWMRNCPDWVTVVLTLIASFTGLFTSIFESTGRVLWFAITAGLVLLAGSIAIARGDERKRRSDWIQTAEAGHRDRMRVLLGHQLHGLLMLLTEAISTANPATRKRLALSTRMAILAAAANLVGQKAPHGTRAHLFVLDHENRVMAREPGTGSGGAHSERIFRPGDETFDQTMARKGVFQGDIRGVAGHEGAPYETFITYPVHVPGHVYGVLTVDCLHAGELVRTDDVAMMSVLANLIAITYACEKYPRPRSK